MPRMSFDDNFYTRELFRAKTYTDTGGAKEQTTGWTSIDNCRDGGLIIDVSGLSSETLTVQLLTAKDTSGTSSTDALSSDQAITTDGVHTYELQDLYPYVALQYDMGAAEACDFAAVLVGFNRPVRPNTAS